MATRKLEETSRLVGATSWAAIASGVFIALALQILLLLLGLAFGLSVGDRTVEGGFAAWAVIVQLASIAVGAALAARISHADDRMGGAVAGVMTWAVALVLGGALQSVPTMMRFEGSGAWAAFLGAALSLGAAIIGGAIGSRYLGRSSHPPVTSDTLGPSHTQPV
jgi:FtsH-binding integral membrane protein